MKRFFVLLMIGFVACAPPPKALAQYIGNVGLQTTQQMLATTLNCTGSAQVFPINNLGQTQHNLSVITGTQPTKFQAELDGIDRQGNVYRISDVVQNAFTPIIAQGQGTATASGYYPAIQAKVTCSPNTATFSLSYSGSQVTFNQNSGSYLNAQLDHVSFSGAAGNVNQTDTYPTPFGSSAGTLYFAYNGPVGGGQLIVTCTTNQFALPNGSAVFQNLSLPSVSTLQTFQMPDTNCPFITISYTSGGAATGITVDYVFTTPGRQVQATQYQHYNGSAALSVKPSAGFLHNLSVNTGAAGTVSIFDLGVAACTGTPASNTVAVITATTTTLQTFTYDVNMLNGICVKASVAMDTTISFQ